MKNLVTLLFFIMCSTIGNAQELSQEYLDTLEDEDLLSHFDAVYRDSIPQEKIARTYLNRARKEKDTIKMARGYDRLARIFHPKKNIAFADSVIKLTENLDNITYPALGYILKGYYYNSENRIRKSMENYSLAHKIAKLRGNINQQVVVSDILIFYKSVWGNKKDALDLQKERHKLLMSDFYLQEVKKASRSTLNKNATELFLEDEILSIQNFVFCHLNLKQLDSAQFYLEMAESRLKRYNGNSKKAIRIWLDEVKIEIMYYEKDYDLVIELTDCILNDEFNNNSSLMNLYFFKGLALINSGNYTRGIHSLKLSDSIFDFSKSSIPLQPYKRELFERLLNHYKSSYNETKSIEYLNKLVSVDSIFKVNYQYFEPEHIKKFETPKLLEEKESMINALQYKNKKFRTTNWWIVGILAGSLSFMFYYFNRQLVYKRRFQVLLSKKDKEFLDPEEREMKSEISSEVVEDIMEKLYQFEKECDFLVHNISLQSLAKSFRTNSNYLSRVVNLKMEKNFSQYIHDLRIEYSMNEILSTPKFRKYTIKAIAEECGYSNAESFSRAFYKKNGIYPSYYIKKLNKSTI